MKIIDDQIKALFKTKGAFSKHIGEDPKDLSSKIRTQENKFRALNSFLKPLDLKAEIKHKGDE